MTEFSRIILISPVFIVLMVPWMVVYVFIHRKFNDIFHREADAGEAILGWGISTFILIHLFPKILVIFKPLSEFVNIK